MKHFSCLLTVVCLFVVSLGSPDVHSATTLVTTQAEYQRAAEDLEPGDTIVLANGVWNDFEILFSGKGNPGKPITLTAQEKGKVIISGQSNLRLAGEYLVVSGLVFKNGYTPRSEVISFRRNKENLANHSRVTEVVIDGFNNPERTETDFWVIMYGKNNRFDHNHLESKNNRGVTMAVRLDTEASRENHHRIDHNYFGHRPILGSNGGETLRIGTSHYSMSNSFTVVENNFFERCSGEVEIISNKSGGNVFRGNVFLESRGTLTLRHGNNNLVENNVFFGNGVDHTGGIRLINKRQTIRNNYLHGLKGYRFGSALTIMNGVPDSPINRYHRVEDSIIENNTIIDSAHIELAAGSDAERSAVPKTTTFKENLIYNRNGNDIFRVHDDISGITFEGNVLNEVPRPIVEKGFVSRKIELKTLPSGLQRPRSEELQNVGASADLTVLNREDTGVSWYPKPKNNPRFDTGAIISIEPVEGGLEAAVAEASSGDIIELTPGRYRVEKLIVVDKPITVRSAGKIEQKSEKPVIEFERTALFEIADGGSLKVDGIHVSGKSAPDSAGNSVIRTSRYSMLNAYELQIDNSEISGLDVNHSFNFLTVAKSTFAFRIDIRNSVFRDISGTVIELDRENDDLGLYNAEYVSITNSRFENIGEAAAVLYRGGTDESTFGPHFELRDSDLINVGLNKRNKYGSSVFLLGVQVASILGNRFAASKPLSVTLTVGDPVTTIAENRFDGMPAPKILNGDVTMRDNTVAQ